MEVPLQQVLSTPFLLMPSSEKLLRSGLSTGSCAAASAKAAALFLLGERQERVRLRLPCGEEREVQVTASRKGIGAEGMTVKDAGDDPDVTHGLEIGAYVFLQEGMDAVLIRGGEGVGKVTRPGLVVPVGDWAINPIPREQIVVNLRDVLPPGFGALVEIFVPRGREVAKRTCNPLLGIEGGISILGTTGLVLPRSCEAFRETVRLRIVQSVLLGRTTLCLVPGNYGHEQARELGFSEDAIVPVGGFIGFALDVCKAAKVAKVVLVGQVGKMVKLAAGIFDTRHDVADARREILFAHLVRAGLPQDLWDRVWEAKTAEEVVFHLVPWEGAPSFWNYLAATISSRVRERVQGAFAVESVIFSLRSGILGRG